MSSDDVGQRVARAFEAACRAEIDAMKPGNVHRHAPGHGMTVEDFLRSAAAAAPAIGAPGLKVGVRILRAVEATREAVGCNTNLGIVLLCAPLAAAALARASGETLRAALERVLAALDFEDARLAYAAIRLAAPAGLGASARHDVREEPEVTLLEAMREAAARDRIAAQYASGFADVFEFGVRRIESLRKKGWPETWAVTGTYLGFLARFEDSHLVRKFGAKTARAVCEEAAVLDRRLLESTTPAALEAELLTLDADLKAKGRNPGTSADLAVASHFAASLAKHS